MKQKNGYPLMDAEAVCQEAIDTWGFESQAWMAIEEMGELASALSKLRRGRVEAKEVITEIADVLIMTEQLRLHFGKEAVDVERNFKLFRLKERIDEYKS